MAPGGRSRAKGRSDPSADQPSNRAKGLSRSLIVETALTMIDSGGPGSVTMRAVGSELGVEAMSLYKHVDSRGQLFDAVVARILDELADGGVDLHPSTGWRPFLIGLAHGVRRYAQAHPRAFPLVATRPSDLSWINPPLRSLDWIEAMLAGLRSEGFDDGQVLFAYRAFNGYLLGFLLLETSALAGKAGEAGDLEAGRYPTIDALAEGLGADHFDAEFELGLAGVLDEIAGQLR